MIVSASRREDLPAFRMDWLMSRLREGSCDVTNPFDPRRVRRVSLVPEDVDCLVLWTRDPRPLTPRARELESMGYRFYVHVTITGYPREIEPGTMRDTEAADAFASLAQIIGPERVLWRYDPVIASRELDPGFHARNFERISSLLEGKTKRVTVSLIDEYARTRARLEAAGLEDIVFGTPRHGDRRAPAATSLNAQLPDAPSTEFALCPDSTTPSTPPPPYPAILKDLASIALSRGMEPVSCAELYDLSALGIRRGACVDAALIKKIFDIDMAPGRDRGQRATCACAPSVDIGEYGSCPALCAYCYARR